jgi:hypothetical protein
LWRTASTMRRRSVSFCCRSDIHCCTNDQSTSAFHCNPCAHL